MNESETVEFKEKLNDKFEKEVVGFLNTTHGGSLYIGLKNDGTPCGLENIDQAELEIKDRIKNNISPSAMGLFEIVTPPKEDYIQIIISGGNQRPYYIKKYGMSPEGCYFRIGSSTEKMSEETILSLFQKRDKRTLKNLVSPVQDLTFAYLTEAYEKKGYEVGDNFLAQLEFFTPEKEFNRLAYLLSDQFSQPIQYARYSGDDVFDLVESKTFVGQSLVKSAAELLSFIQSRNITSTKITPTGRVDEPLFQPIAMRELVINAIVHNDYREEGLPTFEEFSNRLEISSFGGLPEGFSKEDFLNGFSLPVNPELIRVFRDLGYAERLGTGIRRILRFYPKEIFRFSRSFLRASLPFHLPESNRLTGENLATMVLDAIKQNPNISRSDLAILLGKSEATIYRIIQQLKNEGIIAREGGNKTGRWIIL